MTADESLMPFVRKRILIALCIGVACGLYVYALQSRHPRILAYDWTFHWRAARAVLDGLNPYLVVVPSGPYPFSYYWFYPLPSVFLALPTATLPAVYSSGLTVGVASAVLAYAVSRENFSRLPIFLSAQFMIGAAAGSAPAILLTAVCAWPALQWLVVVKPNLGLAAFAGTPTWRAVVGTLLLSAAAMVLVPAWPLYWLRQVFSMRGGETHMVLGHLAPVMVPGGVLLALALIRWRRPEARMLFALACVPQTMTFHDVLPAMLVTAGRSWSVSHSRAVIPRRVPSGAERDDHPTGHGGDVSQHGAARAVADVHPRARPDSRAT